MSTQISKKENQMNTPYTQDKKRGVLWTPAILWLIFLVVHALLVFLGPSSSTGYNFLTRTWGFNNISYYSLPWILLFYLVNVAVCIPVINERIYRILERAMDSKLFEILGSRKFIIIIVFLFIGLVSVGIFWFFKIKYNFLGDMDIRVQQTVKQEFVDTEALTMFVMYHIYRLLNSWISLTGIQTFQWVSYSSGGAFIILALLLADLLMIGKVQKSLFFLFFICLGMLQMFFGYVEVYCLPTVSVVLYLYTGVLYIKYRVSGAVPVIALLAAIGLHLLSVALIPSLVVLFLYRKYEKWILKRKIMILHFIGLQVISIPVIYFAAPKLGMDYFLVPFTKSSNGQQLMTLLSIEHLWEFFNSQMLAGGTGFILFLLILAVSLKKKMKYDMAMWFFATGGLGMLFLAFITNAVRGSGDWDILAFPSLFYTVFGIYVFIAKPWPKQEEHRIRYIIPIFLIFNAMSTAAWVGINASDRSITKIEDMIIGDPGNGYQLLLPDYLSLASNYEANGLEEKMMEILKKSYLQNSQDPRAHYSYAIKLIAQNQTELGLPILENLIIIAPQYPNSYDDLIAFYAKKESSSDLYRIVTKLFFAYLKNPEVFKSVIGKSNLKQAFISLRNLEDSQGNTQRAQYINQVLSQL
jgi:hypothetical protein